jgi:O-antigen ligase
VLKGRLPAVEVSLPVVVLAGLGYLGIGLLAAVPASVAALAVPLRRWSSLELPSLASLLAGLYLLVASAVFSALVHPSAIGATFLQSMGASAAVGLAVALGRPRTGLAVTLAAATLVTAGAVAALVALEPRLLALKSGLVIGVLGLDHATPGGASGPPQLNPNGVGVVASVTGAVWLALALAASCLWQRALLAFALTVNVGVLALLGSGAGWLAFLLGSVTVVALHVRRPVIILAPLVACAVTLALVLVVDGSDVMALLARSRLSSRLGTWSGTVAAISASPLTGRGIGSFPVAYEPSGYADPVANGAHDTFLQVWLDLGVAGLAAVVALTAATLWRSFTLAARSAPALALSGAVAAWLVHSTFESTVIVTWRTTWPWTDWHEIVAPLAFAMWGLAASLDREHRLQRRPITEAQQFD